MATKRKGTGKTSKRKHAASKSGKVITLVNGQVSGEVEIGDQTIQQVAEKLAMGAWLKAYSVRVNGTVIRTPDAQKGLKGVKTLEIDAKDTRG